MLHRIVKLSFAENKVDEFLQLFNDNAHRIRNFPGCNYLQLQREVGTNVLFTYSLWDSDEALQAYRKSEVFREIWTEMKKGFNDRPEAWSSEIVKKLD